VKGRIFITQTFVMDHIKERIALIEVKLADLLSSQQEVSAVIHALQLEMIDLKKTVGMDTTAKPIHHANARPQIKEKKQSRFLGNFTIPQSQIEDLIGTNLFNKIGILIIVVGVFIGAKYAIDKELISPATRILLGYLVASILAFVSFRLKGKYPDFSAVMMSGSISIMYFISFIAYSFYHLFPQGITFVVMLSTTALVVATAFWYNKRVIALLGQVGAYAIPFMLGDGSNKTTFLFAYISIINTGLLFLSLKKNWKQIYQFGFFMSWIIYGITLYNVKASSDMLPENLVFITTNFFIFYATFLSYKIIKKELYNLVELMILLINAFAFFFIGYYLIDSLYPAHEYLTLFTLSNALIHLAIGFWIHKLKLADDTAKMFIFGLSITFITISVPVAFKGNTTTILWAVEALILAFIGYKSTRRAYLSMSAALLILTLLSMFMDWGNYFVLVANPSQQTIPFYNTNFFSSIFVCIILGSISIMAKKNKSTATGVVVNFLERFLPFAFIVFLYVNLHFEVNYWWTTFAQEHRVIQSENWRVLILLFLAMGYLTAWLFANIKNIKNKYLATFLVIVTTYVLMVFVSAGLMATGDLRRAYLQDKSVGLILLVPRYCFIVILVLLIVVLRKNWMEWFNNGNAEKLFSYFFNLIALTFLCNEFIHWMDIFGHEDQYKLGLSIIAGAYAFVLISIGIYKRKAYLRISAIILFAATLVKLIFYDLATFTTVSKTVVLIILGVIMLAASFLYNKYKHVLFEDKR
jgi:uncharacterized membrane protein